MTDDTHYAVLGVPENSTQLEIRSAYRNLLKKIHPDTVATLSLELRQEAEEVAKQVIEAYSILSDTEQRSQYDKYLASVRMVVERSTVGAVSVRCEKKQPTPSKTRTHSPVETAVRMPYIPLPTLLFSVPCWGTAAYWAVSKLTHLSRASIWADVFVVCFLLTPFSWIGSLIATYRLHINTGHVRVAAWVFVAVSCLVAFSPWFFLVMAPPDIPDGFWFFVALWLVALYAGMVIAHFKRR